MDKINPKFHGLSQFQTPPNYELAGKHFHLIMYEGKEYALYFIDGENLHWTDKKGTALVWTTYDCQKADESTYFVHFRVDCEGEVHYVFVLDTAQRLVTQVTTEEGMDGDVPFIRVTPYFGAIKVPGRALPTIRHHLSDRMVGRHVVWHYQPGFSLQHIYYSPSAIRADSGVDENGVRIRPQDLYAKDLNSPDASVRKFAEERIEGYSERESYYPYYEEPCFHIYINDHLNLLAFAEEIMIHRDPNHKHGGGGLILLQDIERVVDFGLSYTLGDYYMVTAWGEENEVADPLDTMPTQYDWDNVKYFPSIRWDVENDK